MQGLTRRAVLGEVQAAGLGVRIDVERRGGGGGRGQRGRGRGGEARPAQRRRGRAGGLGLWTRRHGPGTGRGFGVEVVLGSAARGGGVRGRRPLLPWGRVAVRGVPPIGRHVVCAADIKRIDSTKKKKTALVTKARCTGATEDGLDVSVNRPVTKKKIKEERKNCI